MSKKKTIRTAAPRTASRPADKTVIRHLTATIDALKADLAEAQLKAARAPAIPADHVPVPIELLETLHIDLDAAASVGTQLAAIASSAAATQQNDGHLGHVGLSSFFTHHFRSNCCNHRAAIDALTLVGNAQFLAARIRGLIPARQAQPATEDNVSDVRRAA
jgi:hypothetical protein